MLYGTRKALNALNGHLLNAYKYEVLMRSKVNEFYIYYVNINLLKLCSNQNSESSSSSSSLHCCCNILVRLSLNVKRNITVCDYSFQEAIVILLELITLTCKELE